MNPSPSDRRPPRTAGGTITRRGALELAGSAVLAAMSGSGAAVAAEPAGKKRSKRVVVAGGGIGGLCCAFELWERGHDVTVLEASQRVGGHVKTIYDPLPDGLYADVGAEHFTRPGYDQYPAMYLVYETADEVPGDSSVLMGSGKADVTAEEAAAAFRNFYPGKATTIERTLVHNWAKDPWAFSCERSAFPLGQLAKFWPHIIEPVGRIHFAGAHADNLPWGMDAATRSANRVAEAIDGA